MWPWKRQKSAVIGDGVRIRGKVEADGDLVLAGEVHGDVQVAGALVLRSTARLYGDTFCSALQVEQGAIFAGTNRMGEASRPARPAPAPAPVLTLASAAVRPTPAAPADPEGDPLSVLMEPVGTAEREMLGVIPKAESPAFYGGFNSAIKGV